MKIIIGSDHAGFEYKKELKNWLESEGHSLIDIGPFEYDENDDYPKYSFLVAQKVSKEKNTFGLIIAKTGIGETIVANKVKGIRAVSFLGKTNKKFLEMSRIHDDTNVLCFGSEFVKLNHAKKSIKIWLTTKFSHAKRHERRLKEISDYEKKHLKN